MLRFHLGAGVRLSLRVFAPLLAVGVAVAGLDAEPGAMIARVARGLGGRPGDPAMLAGLFVLSTLLAAWAAPRVTRGLDGWARHLPVSSAAHRRAACCALAVAQAPLVIPAFLLMAAAIPLVPGFSFPRLAGLPLLSMGAAMSALPVERRRVTSLLGAGAAGCALSGSWAALLVGAAALALADRIAGRMVTARGARHDEERARPEGALRPSRTLPGPSVLEGLDLELPAGLTLLVGPNGCGKSTLLKIAAGVEMPDAGRVEIDGLDLWRDEAAARRSLAYVPEQPDLTPYATLGEVMRLVCRLRGQPPAGGQEALAQAGLRTLGGPSIRELSMGERRRAVLAAAMIGRPRTLLLDEPLETMDRGMRAEILSWVEGHREAGALLVIATHEMEPFVRAAARAITVRGGRTLVCEPLPDDPDNRVALLDRLARGLAP